jgi:hypothetical protein
VLGDAQKLSSGTTANRADAEVTAGGVGEHFL